MNQQDVTVPAENPLEFGQPSTTPCEACGKTPLLEDRVAFYLGGGKLIGTLCFSCHTRGSIWAAKEAAKQEPGDGEPATIDLSYTARWCGICQRFLNDSQPCTHGGNEPDQPIEVGEKP